MTTEEFIEKSKKIIELYRAEEPEQARALQNDLQLEMKGNGILDNPKVLTVHLDLEFLTHESGTTTLQEVETELADLRRSIEANI